MPDYLTSVLGRLARDRRRQNPDLMESHGPAVGSGAEGTTGELTCFRQPMPSVTLLTATTCCIAKLESHLFCPWRHRLLLSFLPSGRSKLLAAGPSRSHMAIDIDSESSSDEAAEDEPELKRNR